MPELNPAQLKRVLDLLSNSHVFESDATLQAIFVDQRISSWRNRIPKADNKANRVNTLIAALAGQKSDQDKSALILFLNVLLEQHIPSGTADYRDLTDLLSELQVASDSLSEFQDPDNNPPIQRRNKGNTSSAHIPSWAVVALTVSVIVLIVLGVETAWRKGFFAFMDFKSTSTPELSSTSTQTPPSAVTPELIPVSAYTSSTTLSSYSEITFNAEVTLTSALTPTDTLSSSYEIQLANINQIINLKRFFANGTDAVNDIVFGKENCLISAGENAMLGFWPTGNVYKPWASNAVTSLSLYNENEQNLLAIGGNNYELVFLDLTSMETIALSTADYTVDLSFSKNGKWLAVSNGTHIQIWNVPNLEVYSISTPYEWASLQFNDGGDRLVTGSLNLYTGSSVRNVRVWRIAEDELELVCEVGDSKKVRAVAFSPDGKRIVYGDAMGKIYFANAANCQLIDYFPAHFAGITALAFNASGDLLLSGTSEGTIKIWDVDHISITQPQVLEGHESTVRKIIFNPEETIIASGSLDGRVILWGLPRSDDIYTEMSCSEMSE
jgi:WD40 repeat protein